MEDFILEFFSTSRFNTKAEIHFNKGFWVTTQLVSFSMDRLKEFERHLKINGLRIQHVGISGRNGRIYFLIK